MLTNPQLLCVAIPTLAVKRSVISTNLLLDSLKLCTIPTSRRCIQCRYSSAVVEQLTCNQQVPSSTLGGGTISLPPSLAPALHSRLKSLLANVCRFEY